MGADTPAVGGEEKPIIKTDSKSTYHHGGRNNTSHRNNFVLQKEKFLGADPNLCGQVFKAKRNRSDQVANFNLGNNIIKAQVGAECDPFVLESLEKETLSLPTEPKPVYKKKEDSSETSDVCVQPDEPNSHCGKFETFD